MHVSDLVNLDKAQTPAGLQFIALSIPQNAFSPLRHVLQKALILLFLFINLFRLHFLQLLQIFVELAVDLHLGI